MDTDIIRDLTHELYKTCTLCNWFKLYSALTWNKIGFVRRTNSLKINEVNFTFDLVYNFWLMAKDSALPIEVYESRDEKRNGNDLEIFIETVAGFLMFPCQAKIIKSNHNYSGIKHIVKGREQIDLLIDYAKRKKGIPIYLFYNFCSDWAANKEIEKNSKIAIENFGCSIAQAQDIKNNYHNKRIVKGGTTWKIPSFAELHPNYAVPLHNLVCSAESWIREILSVSGQKGMPIKYYTRDELKRDEWRDLAPPAAIGRISEPGDKKIYNKAKASNTPEFKPKFRIVLPQERRTTKIYRLS